MADSLLHSGTTKAIIESFDEVYNRLGYGFLEKVYENALAIVLRAKGCKVLQQHPIQIHFEAELIGQYYADLLVNDSVIVELKAADCISDEHVAQLLNYLRATRIEIGFVLNFGPEAKFTRKILTNDRKQV
jgi:GxxExxY protein